MRRLPVLLLALVAFTVRADEPKLTPKPDAFPTLVNPNCSHCIDEAKRRAGELHEDDPVLCWTRGYSDGGAIPIRFFLSKHRVISDSYGVFVYDPDAGFARGFAPSYNFVFHGWRNGIMVIKDKKDGTLYSALTGLAFEGPKKGQRLKTVPTLVSRWGWWLEHYPHAVAYHMFAKYKPVPLPKKANADSMKTRPAKVDPRLKPEEEVLGVWSGKTAVAYTLGELRKHGSIEGLIDGEKVFIVYDPSTNTAAAYRLLATQPRKFKGPNPNKDGVSSPDAGVPIPIGTPVKKPRVIVPDVAVGGAKLKPKFDITGRLTSGELKGWTLEPVDNVQCKWFAWAAEYPETRIGLVWNPRPKADVKPKPEDALADAAGSAEILKRLPKPFATLKAFDAKAHTVTLLLDGEKLAKVWPLEPDAEVKIAGFWGRLEQFKPGQRVWVWLKLDRKKNPTSVVMLADERSEECIHNKAASNSAAFDDQVRWLRQRWMDEGLPGTVGVSHLFSGEVEILIDHEGIRWARSLQRGGTVHIAADPPIKAVVKAVSPWRERTQLRLVVGELAASELKPG